MEIFYSKDINFGIHFLTEDESFHCIRVLRHRLGDLIKITDGNGFLYEARIIEDSKKKCSVDVLRIIEQQLQKKINIHLAVAPPKNITRFEWFLEKATEIGISEITPTICLFSERNTLKTERLNKVVTSAMKQSLNLFHPKLNTPVSFQDFIKKEYSAQKFIAYCENGNKNHLKDVYQKGQNALVLIGPEGDFSNNEINSALKLDFIPVSLGSSRLRTETAAIVACHIFTLINEP